MTPENAKTQSWVTKNFWQQIPGRRAHNSETPTTITVQSIPRNDYLPLTMDWRCRWMQWLVVSRRSVRLSLWYFIKFLSYSDETWYVWSCYSLELLYIWASYPCTGVLRGPKIPI